MGLTGALFCKNEFRPLRDVLIARGLMRWSNPQFSQKVIELTNPGMAATRVFVSDPLSRSLNERKV